MTSKAAFLRLDLAAYLSLKLTEVLQVIHLLLQLVCLQTSLLRLDAHPLQLLRQAVILTLDCLQKIFMPYIACQPQQQPQQNVAHCMSQGICFCICVERKCAIALHMSHDDHA